MAQTQDIILLLEQTNVYMKSSSFLEDVFLKELMKLLKLDANNSLSKIFFSGGGLSV